MKISCTDVGKRFNRDWIFKHFNYQFSTGSYAITGPNGSGKSTLLQVIAGSLLHSEGQVQFELPGSKPVPEDSQFKYISIASPSLELVEEMTLNEFLVFHGRFKHFLPGISVKDIIQFIGLERSAQKQLRYFSSGMKQRVKLAQAIFSETPCLFLDEPCTNFDKNGYQLYDQLMQKFSPGRLVIVSSNDPAEYGFCQAVLNILDYKS